MPTIRLKKQNPSIILDKKQITTYIYDHKNLSRSLKFLYRSRIIIENKLLINNNSNYFILVETSKKNNKKFVVKTEELNIGSYLNAYAIHKFEVASDIVRRNFGKIKIPINKSKLRKDGFLDIEYEINPTRISDDKIFTLQLIEIDSSGISRGLDKLEIDHANNQDIYEIPTDRFNFSFSIIDRTKLIVEAITHDKRIGGFSIFIAKSSDKVDDLHKFVKAGTISLVQDSERQDKRENVKTKALNKESISLSASIGNLIIDCDTNESNVLRVVPISSINNKRTFNNFKQKVFNGINNQVDIVPFYISGKTNDSLDITILSAPEKATRVSLHRKNLTLRDRSYTLVGIANTTQSSTISDVGYFDRYDYEYKTSYDTLDGLTNRFTPAIQVSHSTRLGENISLIVKLTKTITEGKNLTSMFDVSSRVNVVSSIDLLKKDLDALKVGNLFENDLKNVSNNIQPLIKIVVSRISKLTGIETFVGLFDPGEINVSCNQEPTLYRFEVVIRSPVELIESVAANQLKLSKDQNKIGGILSKASSIIGQKFSNSDTNFSSKFFTKSSIIDSTLRYGNASKSIDYDYELGRTGIIKFRTIAPTMSNISISNIITSLTFDGIKITCSINIDSINHVKHVAVKHGENTTMIMPTSSGKMSFYIPASKSSNVIIINAVSYAKEALATAKVVL